MSLRAALLLALAIPALGACATASSARTALPDAAPYAATSDDADAARALAASLAAAQASGKKVLAIFGADWCHDSRTLAGWLATPRFRALTEDKFEIVYIDAGTPQTGKGHNLQLAADHGVSDITGTPNVLVLTPSGRLLNTPEDAKGWRNAASRSEEEIFAALSAYAALGA